MKTKNHIYTPILISVILVLLIISGFIDKSILTRENEYAAVLILECVIFAIPTILFTRLTPQKSVNSYKISIPSTNVIPIALSAFSVLIAGSLLYGVVTSSMSFNDSFTLYEIFTAKKTNSIGGILYLAIAYALIPAIFEEFVFRGVVSSCYESISPISSVLMSSLMFGFIHLNFKMFPFYLFSGLILSATLYASKSIFVPILIHFSYNLFFLFYPSYLSVLYNSDSAFFIFIVGLIFFMGLAFFCGECRRIYQKKSEKEPIDLSIQDNKSDDTVNIIEVILSPTAVICYLVFFVSLII